MKKYFTTLLTIFALSATVAGQINFNLVVNQLASKKTIFQAVEIGDVTNDGLNDIVAGSGYYFDDLNDYNVFVYKQNTNGTLADPVRIGGTKAFPGLSDIEIADMNNDNLNDIVVGYNSSVAILYQLPSGGYSSAKTLPGSISYYGIKIGDLNNDGLKDILGYDFSSNFKVFYQNTSGDFSLSSFPSKSWYCKQLEIGDLNGDHFVDIAKIYNSRIEILYQQNGTDITKDSTLIIDTHNNSTDFSSITFGDLNNDGRNDIIAAYGGNTGRYNIYYQKPDGKIDTTNVKTVSTYDCPTPIRIADLNCDGDNEIIIGHWGWEKISVFAKQNATDYSTYSLFPGMYYFNPFSMAVGDINNDKRQDVVTVGQDAKMNIYYNNSKPLTFSSYEKEVANLRMIHDTTDIQTVKYIVVNDTAKQCKKNRSIRQLITGTYANENYSGDSLLIRHGMLCTSFTDTVKTPYTYIKRTLLKTVITESVANFDTLQTSTTELYSGAAQSGISVDINSNICWNVSTDADWINPQVYTGSGKMELGFTIARNLKTTPRTANIIISGDSIPPVTILVYQTSAFPYVDSPSLVIVLSEKINNRAYFEITSNTSWTITNNVEWLSFSKTQGFDNDMITVQGTQNATSADRTGMITIACSGGNEKKISVIQLKKDPNGINDLQNNEYRIYPNPVLDKLIVESDMKRNKTQIQICDLNGIVHWSEDLIGSKAEIDLTRLQKGVYFIKLTTDTKTIVRKIIKQ